MNIPIYKTATDAQKKKIIARRAAIAHIIKSIPLSVLPKSILTRTQAGKGKKRKVRGKGRKKKCTC